MQDETLRIFDERKNHIGYLSREEVHQTGHWHETFHCWFVSREAGIDYVYLQIRSGMKDFPHLLDITAAGHLLAHETVRDGVREVKEELGIDVSMDELVPLGTIKDRIITEDFIDKEFANVFLYESTSSLQAFTLQREELSGIVKAELNGFMDLWLGRANELVIKGFKMDEGGKEVLVEATVGKRQFVPHEQSYYEIVVKLMRETLKLK